MLQAVIFDVGGVLIRTESRAGRQKWADRLGLDSWEFENFVFNGPSGRSAQLGQKTFAAHWDWLGNHFDLNDTETARMRRDFFAGDALNRPQIAQIERLKQAGYRLGILSNFADDARQLWSETFPFIHLFDEVVISSEVGLMKPSPEIYRIALDRLDVAPAQALFIDDFIENVTAARQVGMRAIHFTEPDSVLAQLDAVLKRENEP